MNGTKWEAGQTVVFISGYRHQAITPVRIKKVWKNGVVEIEGRDPAERGHRGRTFNKDGYERGKPGWHTASIRPLEDGETAESILANQAATIEQRQQEQDKAEQEKQTAIDAWWKDEGERFWNNALELNTRLDLPNSAVAYFMQWERSGERRAAVVVVHLQKNKWTNKPVVTINSGGLHSNKYETDDGFRISLSGYTTSNIEAPTLAEALYHLVH